MAMVPGNRQGIAGLVHNGARALAAASGYIAGAGVRGAVRGAANRAYREGSRYFQGDVNQPTTARTVQTVLPMRPVRRRAARIRGGDDSIVEKGTMKVMDVSTTTAANASGRAVACFPLTVDSIGGRLFAMSKLYARWKLQKAVLRYVPSVSSNTDGGLVVYYTQDPDDTYLVGEAVGAANASSAVDNIEFSVREKASLALHVNKTLLFTTPASSEVHWHSAGVINVISNGSLVNNKTYGSIYLDFVASFTQATAPYDVYAPMYLRTAAGLHGAGAIGPGTAGSKLFTWSSDAAALDPSTGTQWLIDPNTGQVNIFGKIYLPSTSSATFDIVVVDLAGASDTITILPDAGVGFQAGISDNWTSTDQKLKTYHAIISNNNPFVAGFTPVSGGTGGETITGSAFMCVSAIPYRAT